MTRSNLLSDSEPPAYRLMNAQGSSDVVLICDHASNRVPTQLGTLGLTHQQLNEHIGWDTGAVEVAMQLSTLLDAPLVMSAYSRLVIDCNRPLQSDESIPVKSAGIAIPGNLVLPEEERDIRIQTLFKPYHLAIEQLLNARKNKTTVVLSIHSFTPSLNAQMRPWHIGISGCHESQLAQLLIQELSSNSTINVGDNQPYAVEAAFDYSLPVHAEARGLQGVMIEIRQDGLTTAGDISGWAKRLAEAYQRVESKAVTIS
jgi:predicted N-formylglutamate amidohydrolase